MTTATAKKPIQPKEEIELLVPIEVGGITTNRITMRRPRLADRIAADKFSGDIIEKEVWFIATLCELAPPELHAMDMADYGQLQDKLNEMQVFKR